MRTWGRGAAIYAGFALLYVAVLVLWASTSDDEPLRQDRVGQIARALFGVVGLIGAVRAARSPDLPTRSRNAWWAVATGCALLVITPPLFLLIDAKSLIDVTHVLFVGALFVALQLFPLRRTARRASWLAALDTLTVVVGGAMVLWYTAFGPYVAARGLSLPVLVSAGAYPVVDIALLYSVARLLLQGADAAAQRPLRFLAASTLVLFAGDVVYGYLHHNGGNELHSPWQFLCWVTADALLALAAAEQSRSAARQKPSPPSGRRAASYLLPLGAVGTADVLMVVAAVRAGAFFPWGGLVIGMTLLTALVLLRENLLQRESDERAVTDGLTGLPNGARFRAEAARALARAARTGRQSATLVIDMNGFKEINDTLGHATGDQALVAFARVLRHCVPRTGLPARLGGDEFAVLLPDLTAPESAYAVARRLAAALGPVVLGKQPVTLAASIGVAVSGPGELTSEVLVHRADLAMYRAKKLGPETGWMIWRDSLEHPQLADA